MKTYTYTVYHIEGVKVGCTTELEKRLTDQGFSDCQILWQEQGDFEHGQIAGDIEIQYQLEIFGKRDNKNHYQNARRNRKTFTNEERSRGGITQGQRNVESGLLRTNSLENKRKGITKIWHQAGAMAAASKIYSCPFCGRNNLKGNLALANHKKHCKLQ
jgi:hypothetical protein